MKLIAIDPATGEEIASYAETPPRELSAAVGRAAAAQADWQRRPIAERSERLVALAAALRGAAAAHARRMTAEMGKPLAQALAEVEKCAWVCEHYAARAPADLADEPVATEASRSFVAYRPLGVVLAVMPWNFPYWQVIRCAAPTLAAGNAVVLKHAPNVPGCALALARLFEEAGFPAGLFSSVLVAPKNVAERTAALVAHPQVAAVTLTGSPRAGQALAAAAGAALKKSVLELGGSDPYVVLADADLDLAVAQCVASRLINSGQSCIAAKRFIVHAAVADDFEQRFVAAMGAARVGPPLAEDTAVGPLARADLRETLHEQVRRSQVQGARLCLGGEIPPGPGWYYPPTVLADVRPGMAAFDEETFGPVAALTVAADDEEALALANASEYGLGGAIFTRDAARGERLAADTLAAGSTFVNAFVRSDPRLPFGGIRRSGYGRELGLLGIREFVNAKTVYVA
jgi:succinate-semialdehyde dehydrogenase/glutarate-semialdehyde dehydrogenase